MYDPWGILRRIGQRHPPDQRPHVLGHCSSPWLPTLTQSCPIIPESRALPGNDRGGVEQ
jgi:hypothetical protein